ncbi:MAG: dihydroorotate dehydrogenase [Ignavibacteriaceae bacterium]|nr:dihydroorotate dehydrogenase [Ignavibacteriaceae bacterium]
MSSVDLSVKLPNLTLKNPILLASGTVGYGQEIAEFTDLNKIGGVVTKSLSLKPRKGNAPQRIVETPTGMLNAIGLANVGVEEYLKSKVGFFKNYDTALICNVAASSPEEYLECVRLLDSEERIDGFEINVSCPNVKDGGLEFGNNPALVSKITNLTRGATSKFLAIKLSPNVARISEFARIAKEEGADAVSAINTLVGTAFDIYSRRPKIKNVTGGLSGPAIRPVALAKVLEIRKNADIPIIGIGGISVWQDVIEFMIAGASAVQLGTINFVNPGSAINFLDNLTEYCLTQKINSLSELTGSFTL